MAKSELILAFNEIAEQRKLPREVIIEALKAALVSAYRRNSGVSSAQLVEARVDDKTGDPSIWVEKEVVDEVQTEQTEVALKQARKLYPDTQMGDMVLVDDTPEDFGRIAAQTAKQVILQRMREAEREAQYQEYADRVGDLITGTVQSDNGDVVTIGLGRTEAILPRSQQMPGERYRMHDKVRAYVMEVRRTNRGPQIVVSRTHRNMLRRLLEYEVPEIYNGAVEIKSIAREPGARSKVAVAAIQPGADPVGACVGMRGVRIQSIVKELNNEKIDVIEWNPEQNTFISKALSPARVSAVFLDDDPESGRTATVVVPDDQLSLAIGREGQNARLGAKLTGWRIDIKSVSEAAQDAYNYILDPDPELAEYSQEIEETTGQIAVILQKKADNRPIMPEDYQLLIDFVKQVEGRRHDVLAERRGEIREMREEAKAQVPEVAYEYPLDETDLPLRVYNLLDAAGYATVGEVMEQYYFNPDRLMDIDGFGPASMEDVQTMFDSIDFDVLTAEAGAEEEAAVAEVEAEAAADTEAPVATEAEVESEAGVEAEPGEEAEAEWEEDEEEYARLRRLELVRQMKGGAPEDSVAEEGEVAEEPEEVPDMVVEAPAEFDLEDEAASPVAVAQPALEDDVDDEDLDDIDEYNMTDEEREELEKRRAKQRRRQLVFDEEAGRVIAKRRRKKSRHEWDDNWDEDWEEFL